jgi:hypothetical protein
MPAYRLIRLACAAVFLIAAGCAQQQPKSQSSVKVSGDAQPGDAAPVTRQKWEQQQAQSKAPSVNLDPCAMNLQELSGALLLYVQTRQQMPPNLAALEQFLAVSQTQLTNLPKAQFTCPLNHAPYGYSPDGLVIPEDDGRIVIYDTRAVHGRIRWAVRIVPSVDGRPPYATVIPLTDEMIAELQRR